MRRVLSHKNERGVALLIVLLVTALLVALVFEFAYATRVSLREAVNFRDSQRAYFLASSGITAFMKYPELRQNTVQGEWTLLPIVSAGDTELRLRWEDERGKINVGKGYLTNDLSIYGWLERLFGDQGVDLALLDSLREHFKGRPVQMLGELHEVLNEEAYAKLAPALTVYSLDNKVNINTASGMVLRSMGIEPTLIESLRPIEDRAKIPAMESVKTRTGGNVKDFLDVSSTVFLIRSYATVGEYTKQVEAVVDGGAIRYWRAL